MEKIFNTFKEDLEYLNFDSVKELFERSTKKRAPLFEFSEYSFGCSKSWIYKNDEIVAIDYTFFLLDNDFQYHYLDVQTDRFYLNENFDQFIIDVLQEVCTRYNIDVWSSLKSTHYYDFTFAYC